MAHFAQIDENNINEDSFSAGTGGWILGE